MEVYSYYDYLDNQNQQYASENNNTLPNTYDTSYTNYMHYITPPIFILTCIIGFLSIICCIIMCYNICKIKSKTSIIKSSTTLNNIYNSPDGFSSSSLTSIILTIICIILYTFCNILDPLAYYTRFVFYTSNIYIIIYRSYNLLWILAKISFYVVLIHRYYLIFDASYFNDPNISPKKLLIFCCFGTLLLIQLILYFGFFIIYYELITNNIPQYTLILKYTMLTFLLFDLFLICILSYLFIISIFKLIIQIRTTKEKHSLKQTTNAIKDDILIDYLDAIEEENESINSNEIMIDNSNNNYIQIHKGTHVRIQTNTSINSLGNIPPIPIPTNISLNVSHSSKERLNTITDTIDICHKYKLTSSSMPEYNINGTQNNNNNNAYEYDDIYSKKQVKLLNITTRIALTSLIAMITSFIYQLLWFIGLEINQYKHIIWFTHVSCIDGLISIICIYLQLEISKRVYNKLCIDWCKCHKCCFNFIYNITTKKTEYNKNIRNVHILQKVPTENSESVNNNQRIHHI